MPTGLDIGIFNTLSVRSWEKPERATSGILSFEGGSNKSSNVALGYCLVDVKNVRIRHSLDSIAGNSAGCFELIKERQVARRQR